MAKSAPCATSRNRFVSTWVAAPLLVFAITGGWLALRAWGGTAPARTLSAPGCSAAVAHAPLLDVKPTFVRVPGAPFGVIARSDGHVFVSLPDPTRGGSVGVFSSSRAGKLRLLRVVRLSAVSTPYGLALSNSGTSLYVADQLGLDVLSVARLLAGSRQPSLAAIADDGVGAIYVERSKDGRYAFVSDEQSEDVSVFDLHKLPRRTALLGQIPFPPEPVGFARSADGKYLFVTSEEGGERPGQGTLTVIDTARAVRTPFMSVVRRVDAGCSPVRVVLSPDGKLVWLTARGSNAIVAFSETGLVSGSDTAPIAVTQVGAAPVGISFFDHGDMLAVANSNRFSQPTKSQTVSIVNVQKALAGQPQAVVGNVVAGAFPREITVSAHGTALYITNYNSGTVETISTAALAR